MKLTLFRTVLTFEMIGLHSFRLSLAFERRVSDFIRGPGFPSAIRVFALTHSRRITLPLVHHYVPGL
jgi:hypothetical protein